MFEEMFKEVCWSLGLAYNLELFDKFLDSKEFKDLDRELRAIAYYKIMSWIEENERI
jgi:hypothetical protein